MRCRWFRGKWYKSQYAEKSWNLGISAIKRWLTDPVSISLLSPLDQEIDGWLFTKIETLIYKKKKIYSHIAAFNQFANDIYSYLIILNQKSCSKGSVYNEIKPSFSLLVHDNHVAALLCWASPSHMLWRYSTYQKVPMDIIRHVEWRQAMCNRDAQWSITVAWLHWTNLIKLNFSICMPILHRF